MAKGASIGAIIDPHPHEKRESLEDVRDNNFRHPCHKLKGRLLIAVATHGFEEDGLVYHPNPQRVQSLGTWYRVSQIPISPL